jgi:hypothetical protein
LPCRVLPKPCCNVCFHSRTMLVLLLMILGRIYSINHYTYI